MKQANICPYSIFGQLTMSECHFLIVPAVKGLPLRERPRTSSFRWYLSFPCLSSLAQPTVSFLIERQGEGKRSGVVAIHDLCHRNYSCGTNQIELCVTCKSSQSDRVVSLIVYQITTRLTRRISHLFALMCDSLVSSGVKRGREVRMFRRYQHVVIMLCVEYN